MRSLAMINQAQSTRAVSGATRNVASATNDFTAKTSSMLIAETDMSAVISATTEMRVASLSTTSTTML